MANHSHDDEIKEMIQTGVCGWRQRFLLDQYIWVVDRSEYADIRSNSPHEYARSIPPHVYDIRGRPSPNLYRSTYEAPDISMDDMNKYCSHIYLMLRKGGDIPFPNRPCFDEMKHLYLIHADEWKEYSNQFQLRAIQHIPHTVYRALAEAWGVTLVEHTIMINRDSDEDAFDYHSMTSLFEEKLWQTITRFCIPKRTEDGEYSYENQCRKENFYDMLHRGFRKAP